MCSAHGRGDSDVELLQPLMGGEPRSVVRIVRLAALSGIAKGPGFLIPIIIAAFFGAGPLTDAYFLAYGGVLLIGGTVGQPLEAAVVPFAAQALVLGRRSATTFMQALFRRGVLLGLASALLGAALLAVGLVIGQPEGVRPLHVLGFYALLAPAAVAWCVSGLYTGALVSGWHLEVGAAGYGFRGIGALVGAGAGAVIHQLWPVALGASVGECARVWWLHRRWEGAIAGLDEGTEGDPGHGFVRAARHQMTAQGMLSGAQFLERFLAGTVAVAAISHVEYATRLIMVAAVLFDGGVGPWLLARWSNIRVRAELRSDWASVYRPLLTASAAALGLAGLLALGAPMIVSVVLEHGAFAPSDALVVSLVLRWYAVGYFFNMSALCVERLLLARAQNRLFAGLSALRAGVRLTAITLLLSSLGVVALPAGYVVSEALYLVALLLVSGRETPSHTGGPHAVPTAGHP